MRTVRLSVATATDPEAAARTSFEAGPTAKNAIYSVYPDSRPYVTQRPSLDVTAPISADVDPPDAKGRGSYYWDRADDTYYVVDDTVYKGDSSGGNIHTISSGTKPVAFAQLGGQLVIADHENKEVWIISEGANTTVSTLTQAEALFTSIDMAGGCVELGGYIFLMDVEGNIYNSDLDNANFWAGDVIRAEREQDTGVFLGKQRGNLVAFGTSSIEFFYNAGNPVGSPLGVRQDVFFRVGAFDSQSITDLGEVMYYVGSEQRGTLGLFSLENLQPTKISNDLVDSAINTSVRSKGGVLVSGVQLSNHRLAFCTIVQQEGNTAPLTPIITWVFDAGTGQWGTWDTTVAGIGGQFPIVSVTNRSKRSQLEVSYMFLSGDIGILTSRGVPRDTTGAADYFVTDVGGAPTDGDFFIDNDAYVLPIAFSDATSIDFRLDLLPDDQETMAYKFCHKAQLVGHTDSGTADDSTIGISYSDDHYRTFSTPRQVSTLMDRALTRWGKFKRRIWRISYSGEERLKIEGLELRVGASRNA